VRSQLATTGEESKRQNGQLMSQLITSLTDASQQLRGAGEVIEGRLEGLGTVLTTKLQDIRSQLEKEGGENSMVVREVRNEMGAKLQQLARQVELVGSEGRKQAEDSKDKIFSTGNQVINVLYNMTQEKRSQTSSITEAMERAIETAATNLEAQTKIQEAAIGKVTSAIQNTGTALADKAVNMVGQMAKSSEAESQAVGGVTKELQTISSELEKHNNERKREAQTSADSLDKIVDTIKDSLEEGTRKVSVGLHQVSSNITSGLYAVKDDIEDIPMQIEQISERVQTTLGDRLEDIDQTLTKSFEDVSQSLNGLPNIKFDVIEDTLENISKDLTSKLEFEGEKLRNSIKEVGQVLVLRKRSLYQADNHQTTNVLESYLKHIVEQNKASTTENKLQQQNDQIRDLRTRLNENNNFNKVVDKVDGVSDNLSGFQNVVSRNAQVSQLGDQLIGLNAGMRNLEHSSVHNRDLSTFLVYNQQNKAAQDLREESRAREQRFREDRQRTDARLAEQQRENQEWKRSFQNQISSRQDFEGLGSHVAGVAGNLDHIRGAFTTDTSIKTLIAALKLQNEAEMSAGQIKESYIRSQLGNHQSSLNSLHLSGGVSRVSEDLHNLEQTIAAGSQASAERKYQESSVGLIKQGIGHNRGSIENLHNQSNRNRNSAAIAKEVTSSRVAVEQFKDTNSQAINTLKDQTVSAKARERNQNEAQHSNRESNKWANTAFTAGVPGKEQNVLDSILEGVQGTTVNTPGGSVSEGIKTIASKFGRKGEQLKCFNSKGRRKKFLVIVFTESTSFFSSSFPPCE